MSSTHELNQLNISVGGGVIQVDISNLPPSLPPSLPPPFRSLHPPFQNPNINPKMLALRCIRSNVRAGTRAMTAFVNPTPPEYINHGTKESRAAAAAKDINSNPIYAAVSVLSELLRLLHIAHRFSISRDRMSRLRRRRRKSPTTKPARSLQYVCPSFPAAMEGGLTRQNKGYFQ